MFLYNSDDCQCSCELQISTYNQRFNAAHHTKTSCTLGLVECERVMSIHLIDHICQCFGLKNDHLHLHLIKGIVSFKNVIHGHDVIGHETRSEVSRA
jgi:hypothetical protein